jgi:hypothetical protein
LVFANSGPDVGCAGECMGIVLPGAMPEVARIHPCKKNYAAEPRTYKPGAHSFSDNEWSVSVWSCDGRSYTCDDSDFDLAMQSMVWPQRYGHKGRVDSSRVFLS